MEKVILFDGTSTQKWVSVKDGDPIAWHVEGGVMTVTHGNIYSVETFRDAHIHVEWREPDMPDHFGQDRGNSGVYLHGRYEVQILDSYGKENPEDDDCGAIYKMYRPLVNASKPPLEWQTYDIYFRAPRFDENGKIVKNAYMTVIQNGVCVQNNIELPRTTPGGLGDVQVPEGPLYLQDHCHPVSFRNVWFERLDEE